MLDSLFQVLSGGGVLGSIAVIIVYLLKPQRTREEENALRIAVCTCVLFAIAFGAFLFFQTIFSKMETLGDIRVPDNPSETDIIETITTSLESYVKNKALPDGKYTGEYSFETNSPNGFGTMRFSSGDIYEGDWKDGLREGEGTMKYKNGDIYRGEWKGNLKNGEGVYKWSDGSVYEGHYVNDMRNGKGTYKNWTGVIYGNEQWTGEYYGEHVNDSFDGQGTFTISNGDMFDGLFKKGRVWTGIYTRNGVEFQIKDGKQVG